jgi:uncharacterized protein (TIGR02678 family)
MSTLHNQLVTAEQEEVALGIRLLLRRPVLTQAGGPDAFDVVRRRAQPLRQWFDYTCGWSLVIEPRLGYARLVKTGTSDDATRPARRHRAGRAPFDRRRYVLFCVVAAELLDTPFTTIGLLADRVRQACAVDGLLPVFDTAQRSHRSAFVDAVHLLESLGAVDPLDGATESYLDSDEAKVLFRVDAALLVRLLAVQRGPSQLGVPSSEVATRFDELLRRVTVEQRYGFTTEGEAAEPSEVQRGLWLRHSILRRLFDEPVLYRSQLSPAQADYLQSPTGRQIMRRAAAQAGFVLEERAEGYLLVDPDAVATDATFPDGGSHPKTAALALLDRLTGAGEAVRRDQLRAEAVALLDRYPSWAKAFRDDDGPDRLVDAALGVLVDFRLVHVEGDVVRPLPAAFRYGVSLAAASEPGGGAAGGEPGTRWAGPQGEGSR